MPMGVYFCVYAGCLFLQWSVMPFIAIKEIEPNLPLICLLLWTLRQSRMFGTLAGFFSGLFTDLLAGGVWGREALAKTVVGYLVPVSGSRLGFQLPLLFVFLLSMSFIHEGLLLFMASWHELGSLPKLMLRYAIPGAVYTALLGCLLDMAIRFFAKRREYR